MAPSCDERAAKRTLLSEHIQNIVVIYAENRSFDNLYGTFPKANGIPGVNPSARGAYQPQRDRDGSALPQLPPTWGGLTAPGQQPVITQQQSSGRPNRPYPLNTAFGIELPPTEITRDLVHKFYENQMQIDGGRNDRFAAYSDAGGLTMSYNTGGKPALWKIAQSYALADNFFMGAFGGSYLNHQYLICACAPEYPNADTSPAHPSIASVERDPKGNFLPALTLAEASAKSALDGPPTFALSGNITPKNYFGDGTFRSINTMLPPYQPSGVPPAADDATHLYANPTSAITLPAQRQRTIGDALTAKGVSWRWYSGAWDETLATATGARNFAPLSPGAVPNFQFHHQPFNYYATFDPVAHADARKEHLKDYNDLVRDIHAGTLPAVTFYKPQGNLNQHSGYASIQAGDEHIAALIGELEKSPQWAHMLVVITYDENGGLWDHVPPPQGDLLGPGTRIPAIIVSPYARRGFIDHTQYDTGSILRLISERFGLESLAGLTARDTALKAHGEKPMGDLSNALTLTR
jgi:acid phosphatase